MVTGQECDPHDQSLRLESKPTPTLAKDGWRLPRALWHQGRAGQKWVGLACNPAQLSEDGIQGWREKREWSQLI